PQDPRVPLSPLRNPPTAPPPMLREHPPSRLRPPSAQATTPRRRAGADSPQDNHRRPGSFEPYRGAIAQESPRALSHTDVRAGSAGPDRRPRAHPRPVPTAQEPPREDEPEHGPAGGHRRVLSLHRHTIPNPEVRPMPAPMRQRERGAPG